MRFGRGGWLGSLRRQRDLASQGGPIEIRPLSSAALTSPVPNHSRLLFLCSSSPLLKGDSVGMILDGIGRVVGGLPSIVRRSR